MWVGWADLSEGHPLSALVPFWVCACLCVCVLARRGVAPSMDTTTTRRPHSLTKWGSCEGAVAVGILKWTVRLREFSAGGRSRRDRQRDHPGQPVHWSGPMQATQTW